MSTPETPPPTTTKQAGTAYVILQRHQTRPNTPGLGDSDDVEVTSFTTNYHWREITRLTATTPENAIRQVADMTPDKGEGYVVAIAIPVRKWRPVKVSVQQINKVTLEDA